jgi:hypothetical protein
MVAFAVDANAIHAFQKERISQSPDVGMSAISAIIEKHVIAIDIERLCYQEWLDCAAGTYPFALQDWITFQIGDGKIEFHELAPNTCRKKLLEYGLPQRDHKWIRLSIGCKGFRLVTEDIDFFDPKLKKRPNEDKEAAKQARKGHCCKSLKDDFGVVVMTLSHVADEISRLD